MKKILHLTLFLALISALAGASLTYVNNITAPIIASHNQDAETTTLRSIYPKAKFNNLPVLEEGNYIKKVWQTESGNIIYRIEVIGFNSSSPISYLLAINANHDIDAFIVLDQQETNGYGSKITEAEYQQQINSLTTSDEFPLISGATITSSNLVSSLNYAIADFEQRER